MQTRYEPRAASGKLKLCLQKKALLQAHERGKCPCCVPDRSENILLPEPGIYPLAPSKKYFRDPAKHMVGSPVSGIFVTDSPGISARPPAFPAFEDRPEEMVRCTPQRTTRQSADAPAGNHPGGFPAPGHRKRLERTRLADVSEADAASRKAPFFEGSWNFLTVTPHP
jgi:hypothetical protein